ncbi:MAG: recombinase family protein [Gaiellaceae bacterium]
MTAKRRSKRAEKRRRHADPRPSQHEPGRSGGAHLAERAERLVYTRKQAAEALGVSLATLDRRIVPALNTVKTPWGTRMIPVRELERFLEEHTQVAAVEFSPRRRAGRRLSVPAQVVARIQRDHAERKSLAEIARGLTADGVPTAHGGRQWWPSTVRAVLSRDVPKA